MSDFLKGNYRIPKKRRKQPAPKRESDEISEELRDRALASIAGSMVYVERTDLTWDGDEDENGDENDADEGSRVETA